MAMTNAVAMPADRPESPMESLNRQMSELVASIVEAERRASTVACQLFGSNVSTGKGETGGPRPVTSSTRDYIADAQAALQSLHQTLDRFAQCA